MSLREYQKKRDFKRTAEPPPSKPRNGSEHHSFVIQKHDASRLHYDFRLEMEGVLKSWAVPKGLPWQQGERHLAVHVEDHPIDYANFEGIIPKGEYGGGTVMVWDVGTYEVLGDDPVRALHRGKIHLKMHGKKAKGEWTLIRTRSDEEKEHWLLLKTAESIEPISAKRDDQSVLTKRTMAQIAQQKTVTWNSNRDSSKSRKTSEPAPAASRSSGSAERKKSAARTAPRKKSAPRLEFIEPMKAKLVEEPPQSGDWVYELKWDGYRALAIKNGDEVEIYSRNKKLLGDDFPEVRDAVRELPVERAILDGEIVAVDAKGHPAFQLLQSRSMGLKRPPIFYYVFDLLHMEDEDLRKLQLCDRKDLLEKLVASSDVLRFSGSVEGDVHDVLEQIGKLGMEGIIGKRRNSVYEAGMRSGAWIKVKCGLEQEFVIGGFTEPKGSRKDLGAIHVGYYDGKEFRYAGKVGAGFNRKLLAMMRGKLEPLVIDKTPFTDIPTKVGGKWTRNMSPSAMREATWVQPKLVCQVRFAEWTEDGALRQPVFLGLREDKSPREVIRERPA